MTTKTKNKATEKDQQCQIRDEYPIHHFTMIPHIIDDADLSPTAYRLYCHLRRITGEDGICWKGVRQLSKDCNLSQPTLIKYKYELAKAGLIRITEGKVSDHPGHHLITICSVWGENHTKYGGGAKKILAGVLKDFKQKNNPLRKTLVINSINDDGLKDLKEIYDFINKNFDKHNGYTLEEARKLATEYTPVWLLKALQRAGDQGKFHIGYVKGILKNWKVNGLDAPLPAPVRQGRKPLPKIASVEKKPLDGFVILGGKK